DSGSIPSNLIRYCVFVTPNTAIASPSATRMRLIQIGSSRVGKGNQITDQQAVNKTQVSLPFNHPAPYNSLMSAKTKAQRENLSLFESDQQIDLPGEIEPEEIAPKEILIRSSDPEARVLFDFDIQIN